MINKLKKLWCRCFGHKWVDKSNQDFTYTAITYRACKHCGEMQLGQLMISFTGQVYRSKLEYENKKDHLKVIKGGK